MSIAYARPGKDCVELCAVFENIETKPLTLRLTPRQACSVAEQLLKEANNLLQKESK